MRVSCDQLDPGYANFVGRRPVRIWIDGIERNNVITADEEQRMAQCLLLDGRGRPVIDEITHLCKREWVHGAIRIECARDAPTRIPTEPCD